MITRLNKEDIELLKLIIKPNIYVITKNGLAKVKSVENDSIKIVDEKKSEIDISYSEVIPIMKGFQHLTFLDLFTIVDLITERVGYGNYKPNHNFVPHFFEVTEESIDLKIQIFHNFDIIYCDNMITNLGSVYHYLLSKNFDVYNLHKKGIVIIDPSYYGTDSIE